MMVSRASTTIESLNHHREILLLPEALEGNLRKIVLLPEALEGNLDKINE